MWRENWAKTVNRTLEPDKHIDHRSYKERGIRKQPTVHIGVPTWKLTGKIIRTERIELNRLIKLDNETVDILVKAVEELTKVIFLVLRELIEAIASAWEDMLVCRYCSRQYERRLSFLRSYEREAVTRLPQIDAAEQKLTEKETERAEMQKKLSELFHLPKKKAELQKMLDSLEDEIEELKKRHGKLLSVFRVDNIKTADELRETVARNKSLTDRFRKSRATADEGFTKATDAFVKLKTDAQSHGKDEYESALAEALPKAEDTARDKLTKLFGKVKDDEFERVIEEAKETAEERQEKTITIEPVDENEIPEYDHSSIRRTISHRDER